MYHCIKVKYLAPTTTMGARLKITTEGKSKIYPRRYDMGVDAQAKEIVGKVHGVTMLYLHWEKDIGYAFCK